VSTPLLVQALLLRQDDPELRLEGDQAALEWVPGARARAMGQQGRAAAGAWADHLLLPPASHAGLPRPPSPARRRPRCRRAAGNGQAPVTLPMYLLGQDVSGRWTFALDVSAARDTFLAFLRDSCELEVAMKDVRLLLPGLSMDAAAIAGQAVALSQWHQVGGPCSGAWGGRPGRL
jgi:hypothetical protein